MLVRCDAEFGPLSGNVVEGLAIGRRRCACSALPSDFVAIGAPAREAAKVSNRADQEAVSDAPLGFGRELSKYRICDSRFG